MKTVTIKPYSLIAVLSESYNRFVEDKIIPLFKDHKLEYQHLFSGLYTLPLIEYYMNFPSNVQGIFIEISTIEDVKELELLAEKHNYQFSVLSFLKTKSNIKEINLLTDSTVNFEIDLKATREIEDYNVAIVGDIHGSFDTFIKMLCDDKGIKVDRKTNKIFVTDQDKYVKHILVGDYLDKGTYKGITKMINFLSDNLEHFHICIGNHEYWVAEYLLGNIKPNEVNTFLIGSWFTSVVLLLQNNELKEKFFKIYNASVHCVETPTAIVTHAPCKNIYLRKEDSASMREMRNMRYPKEKEFTTEEEYFNVRNNFFKFILDEADDLNKLHFFGHTMIPDIFKHKNKICLDTGCVVGGKLSVALLNEEGDLNFKQYENKSPIKKEKLEPYFNYSNFYN